MGLEPMSLTSVALMVQYLNVRQRKWGTVIILTVHILQLDSADTGSLPMEDFFKHIPNYFQITQPGSSTVTPPYQWRRRVPMEAARTNGGGPYQWRRLPSRTKLRYTLSWEGRYTLLFLLYPYVYSVDSSIVFIKDTSLIGGKPPSPYSSELEFLNNLWGLGTE
jgi:hypothetical protein